MGDCIGVVASLGLANVAVTLQMDAELVLADGDGFIAAFRLQDVESAGAATTPTVPIAVATLRCAASLHSCGLFVEPAWATPVTV